MLPAALAAALVIAARLPCPSASPYTCLSLRGSSGTIVSCLKGEETGRLHPTPSSLASEAREASSLSRELGRELDRRHLAHPQQARRNLVAVHRTRRRAAR